MHGAQKLCSRIAPAYRGRLVRFQRSVEHRIPSVRAQQNPMKTAYVGQDVQLAGEYHDSDFDWGEHALQLAPLIAKQETEGRKFFAASVAAAPVAPDAITERVTVGPEHGRQVEDQSRKSGLALSTCSAPPKTDTYEADKWEEFFAQQSSVKFFKMRRYLLLEFPMLAEQDPPQHIIELGAGCGSSILPVLQYNPTSTSAVTDVSGTSLVQLRSAAKLVGIAEDRIMDFVADSCDLEDSRFSSLQGSCCLIMFTLSAVLPDQQVDMLRNAWRSIKPGGLVFIRDHGLYDMVQLRIPSEQWVDVNSYKRGDGTISHYFSREAIEARAIEAGLEVVETKYVCVINHNKKKNIQLKRVFMHAIFRRPIDS